MLVRSCRITIRDWECVTHTVEMTAAAWYAALAQGLAAIRGNDWVAGVAQGLNMVKVSVADVRIEHEVKLMEFTKWLERDGASPRETSDRNRIRAVLGMSTPRSKQPAGSLSLAKMAEIRTGNGRTVALLRFAK
jgi:hypothetical protein